MNPVTTLPVTLLRMAVVSLAVFPLCISTASAHSDDSAHSDPQIRLLKGQAIEINLRDICLAELSRCDEQSLSVSVDPTEGVIFTKEDSDIIRYQHAGTSTIDDSFVFEATIDDESASILVSLKLTLEIPALLISSPAAGASVKAGDIDIAFTVQGIGVDHVHLALTDGEHVSVDPEAGSYRFKDVKPGSYTITGALASSSHGNIADTEISWPIEVIE